MFSSAMIILVISVCFLGITNSINFQSNRQLGSMVFFLTGHSPSDFTNYGCWCSNKDKAIHAPLDEIDECCQNHQICDTIQSNDAIPYPYKASYEDGTIECSNNKETRAHRQCQCDLTLAQCLTKHKSVYTTNLLFISENKCNPGFLLDFDDLPINETAKNIPADYHQFTFTHGLYTTPKKDVNNPSRPNGYFSAMVSSPNVMMSQNQVSIKRTDGSTFSVVSFYAAAAFVPNLKLTLVGSKQYSPTVYNETFFLQIETRKFIELNWSGIDMITFIGTGGSNYPTYSTTCGNCHFAIDDIRFRL